MSITVGLTYMKLENRLINAMDNDFKSVALETKDLSDFLKRYNKLVERLRRSEEELYKLRREKRSRER